MNFNRVTSWLAVAAIAASFLPSADAAITPYMSRVTANKSLQISDLRSAYLVRAGIVRYDAAQMTSAGIREQIQRHFDVVLFVLNASTPQSVEVALERLETTSGRDWTNEERIVWRRQLLRNRWTQLLRLAEYRDRGLFPLNEGQAAAPVPIFVDRHDTACAVGHLMRLSGLQLEVAQIQQSNNLVYVPDALNSAVAAWALTSGLTIEEAALVQPAYGGFPAPYLISDYEAGEAVLVSNGLKYENFHMEAKNYQLLPGVPFHFTIDFCSPNICFLPIDGGGLPNISNVGFNAGSGAVSGLPGDTYNPVGTHWINLGGSLYSGNFPSVGRSLGGIAFVGEVQRLLLSFDVSTVDPNMRINEFAQHSYPTYGGFSSQLGSNDGQFEMTTAAISMGSSVGFVHFEETPPLGTFETRIAANDLPPRDRLTVETTIWLYSGEAIDTYVIGFNVVPEPQTLCLCLGAVLGTLSVRSRRAMAQSAGRSVSNP